MAKRCISCSSGYVGWMRRGITSYDATNPASINARCLLYHKTTKPPKPVTAMRKPNQESEELDSRLRR
jgi:hypothetical protein